MKFFEAKLALTYPRTFESTARQKKTLHFPVRQIICRIARVSPFVFKEYPCLLAADVCNGWEFALFQVVEIQGLALYDEAALKGVALTQPRVL